MLKRKLKRATGATFGVCLLAFFLMGQSGNGQSKSALPSNSPLSRTNDEAKENCLPTGVCLDGAEWSFPVGNMPLGMALSPEGDRLALSLNGWREQGLQIIELDTGRIAQTITQPGAFFGLAFSPDGKTLYASGGNEDLIYRYDWRDKQATLVDSLILAPKQPKKDGSRYPAGIALSRDGKKLYVAENLADSLAVIDVASKKIEQRLPTETYPYAVVVAPDGKVFVSAWGGNTVSAFAPGGNGMLKENGRINAGRHPSALLLNQSGSRLFAASASASQISVINAKTGQVLATLTDAPPSKNQGSAPNALALSADGKRLFVAEADNNAVAVFDLSRRVSDARTAAGNNRMSGRIPVEWYPTALLATKDSLLVLNSKGKGTKANPRARQADETLEDGNPDYTLGQLNGSVMRLPSSFNNRELIQLTRRVARANNWDRPIRRAAKYPPFKHVIYIIKENRTYDQIMSDLPQGDGDASLLFFPRRVSANHHALAERFGLFDRFFVNAEVSSQGHVWSTAAYVTDYGEKTIPSLYSDRRNGNERGDVDEPAAGYLWNSAIKKGVTLRNYGEFGEPVPNKNKTAPARYRAVKPALDAHTNHEYPAFDLRISDQVRADVWLKDFQQFKRTGNMPALQIMHLPADHTAGARPGMPTPRACMADNDLALGRIVEAISNSVYWKDTVVFALEDDAQDGPDHVDSHRSVLLVISAYNRGGVIHRFVNTTDVFATMEEILGLEPLSQFDFYGKPLREIFGDKPDLKPYAALRPEQPLDEPNPPGGKNAEASMQLDLDEVDRADMALFNRVLWSAIKGDSLPYPGTKRMSSLEIARAR